MKSTLAYAYAFSEAHADVFAYHDFRFIEETVLLSREIAKGEDLSKGDYENGLVAIILSNLGAEDCPDKLIDNGYLVETFLNENNIDEKQKTEILYYLQFLRSNKTPLSTIEKVVRDGKDIHLGQPDALERLSLLKLEYERLNKTTYNELEWLVKCKEYFITHSFDTRYANQHFGNTRSKNYIELEKRIDKLRVDALKEKKNIDKGEGNILSGKENEDLFKIAFRNYLNLIALADRKAGLLMQVNSILLPVVIALVLRKLPEDISFAFPTIPLLIGSAITIFYSILASKPLERKSHADKTEKEQFFFGSFDRLDPDFKKVTWEKYSADMVDFFGGDKSFVFQDLIRESFEVRKVLSKKFGYLAIAYKVFFAGLLLSIIGFFLLMLFDLDPSDFSSQLKSLNVWK